MIADLLPEEGNNTSPSMPLGRYMRMFGVELTHGSIVSLMARDVLEPAFVACLGLHDATFLKRVAGVPGDEVRADGATVYVNDRPVTERFTRKQWRRSDFNAVTFARSGKLLPYWDGGAHVIAQDQLFLLADGSEGFDIRDSLDGRYLGPVRRELVQPDPWMFIG